MIRFKDNITLSGEEIQDTILLVWVNDLTQYIIPTADEVYIFSTENPGIYYRSTNADHYQYYIVREDQTIISITFDYNREGLDNEISTDQMQKMEEIIQDLETSGMTWNYIANYLVEFSSFIDL